MKIWNVLTELNGSPEGSFGVLADFNEHGIGMCNIQGESPVWEMHPDTDELFHIIEGEARITLLEATGKVTYTATAGSLFVIPKGIWHKPSAPDGVKFLHYTPGESLHSGATDPRNE